MNLVFLLNQANLATLVKHEKKGNESNCFIMGPQSNI